MKIKIFLTVLTAVILVVSNVFATQSANWILEPTLDFDIVRPMMSEGYTVVLKDNMVGVIDSRGNLTFGMRQGNIARDFFIPIINGVFAFRDTVENKTEIISVQGETLLGPYDQITQPASGFIVIENGIRSFVGNDFSVLVPPNPEFQFITHMTQDLFLVRKSNGMGQIYQAGVGLIGREYDGALQVGGDYPALIMGRSGNASLLGYSILMAGTDGYIFGSCGNEIGVINDVSDDVFFFECDYGNVYMAYYGANPIYRGEFYVRPLNNLNEVFERITIGAENTATFRDNVTGKYGLVAFTRAGIEKATSAIFDGIGWFSEGLAAVSIDGEYGFINRSGDIVIPIQFDGASDFTGGFASVYRSGEWHIIDTNNSIIFTSDSPTGGRYPFFRTNDRLINPRNNFELSDFNTNGTIFGNSFAVISSGGLFGLIDANFNVILEPIYRSINASWDRFSFVVETQDNRLGLVSFAEQVATPTATPNGGTFTTNQIVALSTATEGATIFFTTDGTMPTRQSTRFTEPFTLTETTTVRAFAVRSGMADSDVLTVTFTRQTGNGGNGGNGGGATMYTVTFNTNGGSWIDIQRVAHNRTATRPIDPRRTGFTFEGWYADAQFTTPFDFDTQITRNTTIFARWTENNEQQRFIDVNTGDWFYDYVEFVAENGLMDGVGDRLFAPNAPTTRAMFVTVLWRKAGSPAISGTHQFTDVTAGTWDANAISWAAANDVVYGVGENLFAPHTEITREQMAAILWRLANSPNIDDVALPFSDTENISYWAINAVIWAVDSEILRGHADGTFNPQGLATRAEVAAVMARLMN